MAQHGTPCTHLQKNQRGEGSGVRQRIPLLCWHENLSKAFCSKLIRTTPPRIDSTLKIPAPKVIYIKEKKKMKAKRIYMR